MDKTAATISSEDRIGKIKDATRGIDTFDYDYPTPAQLENFINVVAWHMGTAREGEKDCLTAVLNNEKGIHTVYWIKGNALGSLTLCKPDRSSSALPITGRFRSLSMLRELELQADTRHDGIPPRTKVWPAVTVHWRDGADSFNISTIGLTDDSSVYKRTANFIARLQEVIAQGIDGK